MQNRLLICAFILSTIVKGQIVDSMSQSIDVSDPTQNFTSLHFNVGVQAISREDYGFEMQGWHGAFAGTFGLKKTSFGFNIPFTNNGNSITALGDVSIFAAYQIHNNSGKYKASKLKFDLQFPSSREDNYYYFINNHLNMGQFEFKASYVGSVQLTDQIAIYPEVGFFYRNQIQNTSFVTFTYDTLANGDIRQIAHLHTPPNLSQQGVNIGATFSYKWHSRSFIQLSAQYQKSLLYLGGDTLVAPDVTRPSVENLVLGLYYQYGFTNKAHIYTKFNWYNMDLNEHFFYGGKNREYWLTFGFKYYLN